MNYTVFFFKALAVVGLLVGGLYLVLWLFSNPWVFFIGLFIVGMGIVGWLKREEGFVGD